MEKTYRLRVDGWSNIRHGLVQGNLIAFEVMCWKCACETCFARLEAVKNRLSESEVKWQVMNAFIPERGGWPSSVIVLEVENVPERIDVFLSELLGLQISDVTPVERLEETRV